LHLQIRLFWRST